jgi:AcrR family transcriptional regulator
MALQARARATREAIIHAAVEIFEDTGYGDTGLVDIINHAAVTKGALYFHFSTKESVAAAIIGEAYARIHELVVCTLQDTSAPALENFIRATFVVADRIRTDQVVRVGHELRQALPGDRGAALAAFDARRSVFAGAVEAAIADGDVLADVDASEVADTIRAAVVGTHALLGTTDDAVFTYLSEIWRVVLRGIVPARSLPYFREFATRMGQQYVVALAAQAR